jgi:protein TonB
MFAAVRSGAGWLLIGTALGLAGCSAIPLPDISIPMPTLPGFGPPEIPAAMEPTPLAPLEIAETQAAPANAALASERPTFFVQWKPNMPGLTRRPRIAAFSTLPEYPESARRGEDEGVSGVEGCVTVEGRLVDVKLSKSSGSVTLDSATLAWARIAKFEPAEFNGQPMAVCGYGLEHEWRVEGN